MKINDPKVELETVSVAWLKLKSAQGTRAKENWNFILCAEALFHDDGPRFNALLMANRQKLPKLTPLKAETLHRVCLRSDAFVERYVKNPASRASIHDFGHFLKEICEGYAENNKKFDSKKNDFLSVFPLDRQPDFHIVPPTKVVRLAKVSAGSFHLPSQGFAN